MKQRKHFWLICFLLAFATLAVFAPAVHYNFLVYDDPDYVTMNKMVGRGLSWEGLAWAFQSRQAANWHPVTWISHMLDCQVYGLNPAGHHLTNILFHTVNTLLLFGFLNEATRAMWRSALVAALFALHPLHVESVAWVSERKDVLSAFFLLLTLGAYMRYARHREEFKNPYDFAATKRCRKEFLLALLFFALGLMSKPMLVTLPFALLLLDFWPLQRFSLSRAEANKFRRLCVEKIPFLILSVASSIITYLAQKNGGAVMSLVSVSLWDRIGNALVSYVQYLFLTFFPVHLAVLYPFHSWPLWEVISAVAILLFVSVLAWRLASREPSFVVGWFWFLGTLIPVIGLVQVGLQSMADRYFYIPSIGLFVALVWGAGDWLKNARWLRVTLASLAIAGSIVGTSWQLRFWQNDFSLFGRTLALTTGNFVAHNNLGVAYSTAGEPKKALPHFLKAIQLRPNFSEAYNNAALALSELGKPEEAIRSFQTAIQLSPNYTDAIFNLGRLLAKQGKGDEAIACFKNAVRIRPDFGFAQAALGSELAQQGKLKEAIEHYQAALREKPDDFQTHYNLANALFRNGQPEQAIQHYEAALEADPGDAECHNNLGIALQRLGAFEKAASHFQEAIRIRPAYSEARFNLAMLWLRHEHSNEALAQLNEVVRLQPENEQAHFHLAELLVQQNRVPEALRHFRTALRLKPEWPGALNFLARLLATSKEQDLRDGKEAVNLARHACELSGYKNSAYLDTLGAAHAEADDFAAAIQIARQARELAVQAGQKQVAEAIGQHIEQYQSRRPLREF